MARGRQKGQTKRVCKIKDKIIAPYEVWIDEDQFTLLDTTNNKTVGYFNTLDSAIKRVSRLSLANSKKDYTLAGFIESFNNRTDKGWVSEIQPINIKFSNPKDPENSNIELESVGGHFYTIYTESNDLSPLEMVERLKKILN